MTDGLVTWLRAQLDEDERVALACEHKTWTRDGASIVGGHSTDEVVDWVYDEGGWEHIARHDPARVLAEVDAKRRILDEHGPSGDECRTCCGEPYLEETWDGEEERTTWKRADKPWPCPTIRLLALPFADRPGYRDEWKP